MLTISRGGQVRNISGLDNYGPYSSIGHDNPVNKEKSLEKD